MMLFKNNFDEFQSVWTYFFTIEFLIECQVFRDQFDVYFFLYLNNPR